MNRNIPRKGEEQSHEYGWSAGDATGYFGDSGALLPDNQRYNRPTATQGAARGSSGGMRISMQGQFAKRGLSRPLQTSDHSGAQPFQVPDFTPQETTSKFRVALPGRAKTNRLNVSGQHWNEASQQISRKFEQPGWQGPKPGMALQKRSESQIGFDTKGIEASTPQELATIQPVAAKRDKPFQFLSSLGNAKEAGGGYFNQKGGPRALEQSLGLGAGQKHRSSGNFVIEKRKNSQLKIFTQLNVGKPIPTRGHMGGYVVVSEAEDSSSKGGTLISHREQKEFKITRQPSALGIASARSRRDGSQGGAIRISSRLSQQRSARGGEAYRIKAMQDNDITVTDVRRDTGGPVTESIETLPEDGDHSFGKKLMSSRPTTAIISESDSKLPYPELFDRTERTFAATFAKFGDLSYFTPVQRIGIYMDYSQRLQRRHLTDLIAYLKTAKHTIKPLDEDQAKTEAGQREFLTHCLFHGSMPLEDAPKLQSGFEEQKQLKKDQREAMKREFDFPLLSIEDQGQFQYNQVWSQQLMRQVEVSTVRFLRYIDSPDSITNEEVAKFRKEWMQKALDLIPEQLLTLYSEKVKEVFQQVFQSYITAMKTAVLEYILRSPDERKRLHILMLPQARQTSAQRHAKSGGYSIVRYPGHHQRRQEAGSQLKLGLLNCNIATSSLIAWWNEFQHFDLIQMRGLGQFIKEKNPGKPESAIYAMELEQFFAFQTAYQQKVVGLLRHVWHRGCILITKKFKMLRTMEERKASLEGRRGLAGRAKWTFKGFKPGQLENNERKWVDDAQWRAIYKFDYDDSMTPLQAYYMRAASVHQNIHLHYFLNEEGLESTDAPNGSDFQEGASLSDLSDIRDCSAYRSYMTIVGGTLDLKENGFKALDKQFRKEIQSTAAVLMERQLRSTIDRSLLSLLNFFKGFLTLEELKKETGKPLRLIRPLITKEPILKVKQPEMSKQEKANEAARRKNPALAAQLARRRQEDARRREEAVRASGLDTPHWENPELKIPDFMDFQDFVSPVFRLDLLLRRDDAPSKNGDTSRSEQLQFSMSDASIIGGFQDLIDRVTSSFDDFLRPEYCKIKEMSAQKLRQEWEQGQKEKSEFDANLEEMNPRFKSAGVIQNFDTLLYSGSEDIGPDVYKKFMGRLQTQVNEMVAKGTHKQQPLPMPNNGMPRSLAEATQDPKPEYIPHHLKVTDRSGEEDITKLKREVLKIIKVHLNETKGVLQVFDQFQCIIRGTLTERIKRFIAATQDEKSAGRIGDKDYAQLIKELRYYQKLSRQLPTLIFLPMFEVGTKYAKDEIQRRIDSLLDVVFECYEAGVIKASRAICAKYDNVAASLSKTLSKPEDVAEMEKYKTNLLLQMGRLQGEIQTNREQFFFLLRADRTLRSETQDLIVQLYTWPKRLDEHIVACEDKHEAQKNALESQISELRSSFLKDTASLQQRVQEVGSWGEAQTFWVNIEKLRQIQKEILEHNERMNTILEQERMIFGNAKELDGFSELRLWFAPFYELGISIHQLMSSKRTWMGSLLTKIDPFEVEDLVRRAAATNKRLQRELADFPPALKVLETQAQDINNLSRQLPFTEVLCNQALRPRHWDQIFKILHTSNTALTFGQLEMLPLKECFDQLAVISEKAEKEARLDGMLKKMQTEWEDQYLELTTFRDTKIQVLVGTSLEENMGRLEEHRLIAMTIRSSPDVGPLLEEAQAWESKLILVQEILEIWIRVQANFLYLEPVMRSEDIMATLPAEATEFEQVYAAWSTLVSLLTPRKPLVELTQQEKILPLLQTADQKLENILKSMSAFLESKRQSFARFYFLSNEELLDALGQSTRPERVQEHLKKCFEGIDKLVFVENEITGLVSAQGEIVNIVEKVCPSHYKGQVEEWLLELEAQMESSVKNMIQRCIEEHQRLQQDQEGLQEKWLLGWPGQAILVASQNAWTQRVEESLSSGEPNAGLRSHLEESQESLRRIADLVRKTLPKLIQITLGSLIVLEVHAKDVLSQQIFNRTSNINEFSWISQLRHKFDVELKQIQICMIATEIAYGHEYLGNTSRLVITPLTDRCYRTLVSALSLNLGGAPEGPAGTGKTETTKDLAKVIAVHCLVFNCAEGLDALSMAKFFKGLASSGSWSCFDEFNRIDVEVLSVVAQQILDIQVAKSLKKERFLFEDSMITLRQRCNIFITMNPGYAGRAELPDNLKALFRPVAMMIPDYAMIGEITLYSYGFQDSRVLSSKIVATFRLCSEQLSSQHHYDYGMRAVKSVLSAAGSLKQRFPHEAEQNLILKSITNVSLPMFLANDIPLFEGILSDIFTEILVPGAHEKLETCIEYASKQQKLQNTPSFMAKVLQLYEMMDVRHGMMLVGPPLAAKTSTYRVLAAALARHESSSSPVVDTHVINPKSLTMAELYGSFDPMSHEFSDGVLGKIFRNCANSDRLQTRQWIVFDGPIDAEWIENMNTVLDDNKKLCLLNGEGILMSDNMKLIFEADDLSQASPATVSRCGMVYLEPAMLGVKSHLESWLSTLSPRLASPNGEPANPAIFTRIEDLFQVFFSSSAKFVQGKASAAVYCSEVQCARSLMNILEAQLVDNAFLDDLHDPTVRVDEVLQRIDMRFLHSLIWSVGSFCDEQGQREFSNHLRKISQIVHTVEGSKIVKLDKNGLIPDGGQNLHEFHIEDNRWVSWKETLQRVTSTQDLLKNSAMQGQQAFVPTTESLKITSMLGLCLAHLVPVLLVGPTGTAKSVSVQQVLREAPRDTRAAIQITFSAKSTSRQTSEILLSKLEKRGRRAVGPQLGKRAAVFVDDLNMPSLQKYGAQPAVELLRQLIDHRKWYDQTEKGSPQKEILDLDFIAAMGPPGGGRNPVTQRLTRHFNVIYICNFREDVLLKIFGKVMDEHTRNKGLAGTSPGQALKAAVTASVDILLFSQQVLRPTPSKSHYLFNLRDLGRVVQGLQMVEKAHLGNDSKKVLRLWIHEVSRVFSDRLTTEEDQRALFSKLCLAARDKMREDLVGSLRPDFGAAAGDPSLMTSEILFTDILSKRAEINEILPQERAQLNQKLLKVHEDFNSVSKKPLEIVLFKNAVVHLLRIYRIIKMPQGHAFLIGLGGTGRQSLTRLAAYLCDQALVDIETSKNYHEEQWREQLKSVIMKAGQDGKSCVLLLPDSKIKGSFMLDDINNLLNSGDVPNLFLADEKMKIEESLRATAKRAGKVSLYSSDNHQDFEDYFIERTKSHLHIILAMSPIGGALRDRIRNFPSLANCCTIDWFNKWPDEALEAVCAKVLEDVDMQLDQRRKISRACRILQQEAIKLSEEYLEKQRRQIYITPTSYLELLKAFKTTLASEREKTLRSKNGYDQGVQKLLFTAEQVLKMRQELKEKQPKLVKMTQETDVLMKQIEKESIEVVQPKQTQIREEEAAANKIALEAQAIKQECDDDLGEALPILRRAIEALNTIKSQHINEIKVLGKPPDPIKKVLQAVCVMCQRKVERTPKKDNPKEQEDNWWLTSQKFMAEKNFLQGLLEFDKDHIPDSVLKKIRDNFIPDPDFKPSRVEKASVAAKGLCQWVIALDQYSTVAKLVAPKRARAKEAQAKYQETLKGLALKQAELQEIISQFEALQTKLEDTKVLKQKLQDDIDDCQKKIIRAKALLEGLGGEQSRWQDASLALDSQYQSLNGDCLLAAATIAYLGPVTGDLRAKYLKLWKGTLTDFGINISESYSLQNLLGEPITIRQWEIAGLPTDSVSVDNGILATRSRRWPLMIDPQGQASKWIRNLKSSQFSSENTATQQKRLVTVKPNDHDFSMRFQNCIPLGFPILLEGVGEELDPVLENLLEKQTFKKPGGLSLMFGDSLVDYSPDFQLFITTKLANPHFLPEVSTKVALINFGITFDGLKEQLMDVIVQRENSVLDEERQKLIQTNFEFRRTQRDIEQRILDVLQQSQGSILDDELAIETLAQSQQLAREIQSKQEVANLTQQKLDLARTNYSPIAHHCSLLFFLVSKLVLVDVMYQYSLTWFFQLFSITLDSFRRELNKVDYDAIEQQVEEVQTPPATEHIPIEQLIEYFTYQIFSNVCRSLFERDKLLFSFLLTTTLAQARGAISSADHAILVQVFEDVDYAGELTDNFSAPWLPSARWTNLFQMSQMSTLIDAVYREFRRNQGIWRAVVESSNPYQEEYPQVSVDGETVTLGSFTKLCLIKALVPAKFVQSVRQFVVEEQGEAFLNPPLFNIERSFQDSSPATPLIFILPGADPLQALVSFAQKKKKYETLKTISLGQGQGAKAEQAIQEARKKGGWVMLQNCHLYPSWMARLEQICDQLATQEAGRANTDATDITHSSFRLWLSSYPSEVVPALVLRNGVKMTNEPPGGFRANMLKSFTSGKSLVYQTQCESYETRVAIQRLLYNLCMFHAIVQGRKSFGSLGWNCQYVFTNADLEITTRQLLDFANSSPLKQALITVSSLAGECNYGGRITDERDSRVLLALLEEYCTVQAPMTSDAWRLPPQIDSIEKQQLHIHSLPLEESPELFGLHPNASLSKDLNKMRCICQELDRIGIVEGIINTPKVEDVNASIQVRSVENTESKVKNICAEILKKLPKHAIDLEFVRSRYPVIRENSLNSLLVQELQRFNPLVEMIRASLENLLETISGAQVASAQTEKLFDSILHGEIPEKWRKVSYPSLRFLGNYISDLCQRLQVYEQWIQEGPPTAFWFPGFFFPQSFLTSILQDFARKNHLQVDSLIFGYEFESFKANKKSIKKQRASSSGAYIYGLHLEGASWSLTNKCIEEPSFGQLFSEMSLINLVPRQAFQSSKGFECPIYRTASRQGQLTTTGHSTNFVMYIDLPCGKKDLKYWTKRGVAMLCEIAD